MKSFLSRARALFSKPQPPAPVAAAEADSERLQVLVGRQRAIIRGRASVSGSEGLFRDAL